MGKTYTYSTLDQGYDFFITDQWKEEYRFKIFSFPIGPGIYFEAIEVVENKPDREPYIFHLISDIDEDVAMAELALKAKIEKGINRKYLKYEEGRLQIGDAWELWGRLELNYNGESDALFVVDGKKISTEQFLEMLEPYTAFNFKFKIYDSSDEEPD